MYSQLQEGAVDPSVAGEAAGSIAPPSLAADLGASDEPPVASTEVTLADDTAPAVVHRPSSLSVLKAEIARAMQGAADRERARIDVGIGEDESAQVEKILGRASAEAAELSKHADQDVSVVNAWYKDQVKRIRAEADRQIDDRRTRLEQSLTHHGTLIEAEVESVHVAVQGYRASLDAFFGRLAEERDPSAIARLAGDLPDPPDLDEVRAEARSAAMQAREQEPDAETPSPDTSPANGNGRTGPERELVPVMDTDAVPEPAGALDGTAIVATAVPAAPVASAPPSSPAPSDGDEAVSSPDAVAAQENVAVRLIRAIANRTSTNGAHEDQ